MVDFLIGKPCSSNDRTIDLMVMRSLDRVMIKMNDQIDKREEEKRNQDFQIEVIVANVMAETIDPSSSSSPV